MAVLYTDDARTTLAANLTAGALTCTVTSSTPFPTVAGLDYFYATIIRDSDNEKETVRVTAVVGTTWTLIRATGPGESGLAFVAGDTIELRMCKNLLDDISAGIASEIGNFGYEVEEFTGADGVVSGANTVFTTTAEYVLGIEALQVEFNGAVLPPSVITELTTTTFHLNRNDFAADDEIVVRIRKQLSVDAVLASSVSFTPAGSGTAIRSVETKLREFVSITDFGAATTNSGDDNRTAIQAAIAATSAAGQILYVPAGTYELTKGAAVTDAGGTAYPCLLLASNLHIVAEAGAVFKIADNQSSDASPFNVPLMYSVEVGLENIRIHNLTFDSNSDNNDLNEQAMTWSQFGFSGSPTASTMAHANDVWIENCQFINNPGATCIGMAQSEITSGTLGKRWTVKNCYFYNNGYKNHDHSSIYGLAEDVLFEGCTFDNPDMFGTQQLSGSNVGGQVAFEVHGANTRFVNNKVKNYAQGLWLASNRITDADNIVIAGNTFSPILEVGIDCYRQTLGESIIRKIEIYGNTFGITDGTSARFKTALTVSANYAITDIHFHNNTVEKVGTTTNSSMVAVGAQNVAAQKHSRIKVNDNTVRGMCFGLYLTTTATNGLGDITFNGNDVYDLASTAAFTETAGVLVNLIGVNTIDSLTVRDNSFIDSSGSGDFDRGIYLYAGTITDFTLGQNSYIGMAAASYTEVSTITNRHGTFPAVYYPSPDFRSSGSSWTLSNGSRNAYYKIDDGWVEFVAKWTIGAADTIPGGNIQIGLPFASIIAGIKYIGFCLVIDSATGTRYQGQLVIDGTGTAGAFEIDGGTFFTTGAPLAIGTGDEVHVHVRYRIAE